MKNSKVQIALSAISLFSILLMTINVKAGSIGLNEVVQVVNSNPQNTRKNGVTELRVSQQDQENPPQLKTPVASTTTATTESATPQQQDGNNFPPSPQTRIQDESGEIVEITEEQCDCADLKPAIIEEGRRRGFPFYLLGIAAVPLIFLATRDNDDNPSPPTSSPTPTSPGTVTTPTMSPSVPDTTPTPEPLSILLFGTGLAGLGAAARRRFKGKKNEDKVKA